MSVSGPTASDLPERSVEESESRAAKRGPSANELPDRESASRAPIRNARPVVTALDLIPPEPPLPRYRGPGSGVR